MSNKESRIKSLPDVFMLSSGLVQFKYVQDIGNANDVNFLCWHNLVVIKAFGDQTNTKNFLDKYLTWWKEES